MDERETPLRGGRTIAAIVRIEDSVRRPVGPRSAFVHQLLISLEREGFPVRHDFSRLTHRAERYFSFLPSASCELTNGVEQKFNELTHQTYR